MMLFLDRAHLVWRRGTLPRPRVYHKGVPGGSRKWVESTVRLVCMAVDEELKRTLDLSRMVQPLIGLIKVLLEDLATGAEQRLCNGAERFQGTGFDCGHLVLCVGRV